jgi:hypothetical protein
MGCLVPPQIKKQGRAFTEGLEGIEFAPTRFCGPITTICLYYTIESAAARSDQESTSPNGSYLLHFAGDL